MDCAPLNLAHFHERRADKFIRCHRYDDALKAVQTSMLYLQDAYKSVIIPKSIKVLDVQKWEYDRKLQQIQMRKQQYERLKLKEIVPLAEPTTVTLLRPENVGTAQSVAKSIDKTIKDFNAKLEQSKFHVDSNKENKENRVKGDGVDAISGNEKQNKNNELSALNLQIQSFMSNLNDDDNDVPTLAPLELSTFDFDQLTLSPALLSPNMNNLIENFQK